MARALATHGLSYPAPRHAEPLPTDCPIGPDPTLMESELVRPYMGSGGSLDVGFLEVGAGRPAALRTEDFGGFYRLSFSSAETLMYVCIRIRFYMYPCLYTRTKTRRQIHG